MNGGDTLEVLDTVAQIDPEHYIGSSSFVLKATEIVPR